MEGRPEWVAPLLRGLAGLAAFAVLFVAARWQFVSRRGDEPYDSGVD